MRVSDYSSWRLLMQPVLALVLVLTQGLSACASKAIDTRYLHSEQRQPLQIPAGMDTPDYNPRMQVPAAEGNAVGADIAPQELELPPKLDTNE